MRESLYLVVLVADCACEQIEADPVLRQAILGGVAPWHADTEENRRRLLTGMLLTGRQVQVGGESFEVQELFFNTALSSERYRLAARIAAQFEIWPYVEGENREWFARLIEHDLEHGPLRSDMGWERVVAWLRTSTKHPVVLSGSVTDQPPKRGRWTTFMKAQRAANKTRRLEMCPDEWEAFRVGSGTDLSRITGPIAV